MKIVVYQYTEAPLVLENVTSIIERNEGDTIIIQDSEEGRLEFQDEDIIKFEGPNHGK